MAIAILRSFLVTVATAIAAGLVMNVFDFSRPLAIATLFVTVAICVLYTVASIDRAERGQGRERGARGGARRRVEAH